MRKTGLATVAAAFLLTSVATAPLVAIAQPSPSTMHHAGEIKDPVKADRAIAKAEAKDAHKRARIAHHKAKVARHKAKVAAHEAAKAER